MAVPGDDNPESQSDGDAADPVLPQRLKVLVVEDHVEMAKLMARLLVIWGHDAIIANDGATALSLAQSRRPRVILADIYLPDMDGYQLARELRRLTELKSCLLIAQTGFAQEKDRETAIKAGFDHHFIKPLDLKLLRQMLNQAASTPLPRSPSDPN